MGWILSQCDGVW